jgi:hypothetical protein
MSNSFAQVSAAHSSVSNAVASLPNASLPDAVASLPVSESFPLSIGESLGLPTKDNHCG